MSRAHRGAADVCRDEARGAASPASANCFLTQPPPFQCFGDLPGGVIGGDSVSADLERECGALGLLRLMFIGPTEGAFSGTGRLSRSRGGASACPRILRLIFISLRLNLPDTKEISCGWDGGFY